VVGAGVFVLSGIAVQRPSHLINVARASQASRRLERRARAADPLELA